MIFCDYSPPTSPSSTQQRDALQKGLGRALQWAVTGRLDEEILLEACLRDQRFDAQVEDARGDWLWWLMRTVGVIERFRVPILHALHDLADERSAIQLCELARCYAESGDETFHARLYEIVAHKPFPDRPWLGEEEVVELDGEHGFLFAAQSRGKLLAYREWECDDESFVACAVERVGEERINSLLEASSDEAIRRFRESWRRERQRSSVGIPRESHRERMTAIPVGQIIRAAEGQDKCYWFRGWGICAEKADLKTVLQHLWSTREPTVIAKLLRVFSRRALPEFDARLIDLCRHSDEEVRRWGFRAMEQNAHPLVRDFALIELQKGGNDAYAVALFINNYRSNDEQRILEAMKPPEDKDELHWLLMDIIKVLEKNPEADCSRLAVISYAMTPCASCRFDAAQLLLNHQAAPEWLAEECRYDSGEDCRKLANKTAGSSETG